MKPTDKQIAANRLNALRSTGPATDEGKKIASRNSLKHGLLAREVVISGGESAENPQQFHAVLADLQNQFSPQGALEEMLVEKIAVAYWRLRRAHKYEVGMINSTCANVAGEYYKPDPFTGKKINRTDPEIDKDIEVRQKTADKWQNDKDLLKSLQADGKDLEETYDFDSWDWLYDENMEFIDDLPEEPAQMRLALTQSGWSDEDILQAHIEICDRFIKINAEKVQQLRQEKEKNAQALQNNKMISNIPAGRDLDRLLKYENSIERQFYKAIDQLERLQRLRAGDKIPPPFTVIFSEDEPD